MEKFTFPLMIFILMSLTALGQKDQNSSTNDSYFQTVPDNYVQQQEQNNESLDLWKRMDDSLKNVYNTIIVEYAEKKDFIEALKTSQDIWLQLRNANITMRYPKHKSSNNEYGSVLDYCLYTELIEMTEARTVYLNQWLHGKKEGDVCLGSIKMIK